MCFKKCKSQYFTKDQKCMCDMYPFWVCWFPNGLLIDMEWPSARVFMQLGLLKIDGY